MNTQTNGEKMIKKFFFYGTLDKKNGVPKTENCIVEKFRLFMKDGGWFPCAMPAIDKRYKVYGAIHDYSKLSDKKFIEKLEELDRYEGMPFLYTRVAVEVKLPKTSELFKAKTEVAYMYVFLNPHDEKLLKIRGGDWKKCAASQAF